MQNDLISRSALLKEIRTMQMDVVAKATAIKVIEWQPTAYDMDKVDQQILDYFKEQINKKPDGWDIVDFSCDIRNIVRNGGKE